MGDVEEEKRVLFVGLVCVDIISVCEKYPEEDSDSRCVEQKWARGGNASNNSTVMSHLGAPCEFMGTMADSHELGFLKDDFTSHGIHIEHCVYHRGRRCPFAVAIINLSTGSRTIINSKSFRNLPELSSGDFIKLDLDKNSYKWIHFEGRTNASDIKEMLQHIRRHNESIKDVTDRITTSVELEKPRPQLDCLLPMADVVFIGKDFARVHGFHNKEEAARGFRPKCQQRSTLICAWGESGAIGITPDGAVVTSSIFPPEKVVDTLGAGDTFTAASIFALNRGLPLQQSIEFGCRTAGFKVGNKGFDEIGNWYSQNQL